MVDFPAGMGVIYNGVQTLGNNPGRNPGIVRCPARLRGRRLYSGGFLRRLHRHHFPVRLELQPLGSYSHDGTSDTNVGTALFLGAFDAPRRLICSVRLPPG